MLRQTHTLHNKWFPNQAGQFSTQRCLWGPTKALRLFQTGAVLLGHSIRNKRVASHEPLSQVRDGVVPSLSAVARMSFWAEDTVSAFPAHSRQKVCLFMKTVLKKRTKLSRSIWLLFKQLQLTPVMLPTGVYKSCGPAVNSTLMWWGVQTCKPEWEVPGAAVANGKGHLWCDVGRATPKSRTVVWRTYLTFCFPSVS